MGNGNGISIRMKRMLLYAGMLVPFIAATWSLPGTLEMSAGTIGYMLLALFIASRVFPDAGKFGIPLRGSAMGGMSRDAKKIADRMNRSVKRLRDGALAEAQIEESVYETVDCLINFLANDIEAVSFAADAETTTGLRSQLDSILREFSSLDKAAVQYWACGKLRDFASTVEGALSVAAGKASSRQPNPNDARSKALLDVLDFIHYRF